MRASYLQSGASLYYYNLSWLDQGGVTFNDVRGLVGASDPSLAEPGSLRGSLMAAWQKYGLPQQPNQRDNCLHASTSSLDALAERFCWLCPKWPLSQDPLAARLVAVQVISF